MRLAVGSVATFGLLSLVGCSASSGNGAVSATPIARPGPYLTSLMIQEGPPLSPPFSSSIHDYAIRCVDGANQLTLTLAASPGATSFLRRPLASASEPAQTLSLEVGEGKAIVAVAKAGASESEYWIRCLPEGFPEFTVKQHPEIGALDPGYYLLGTGQNGGMGSYAMVLDQNGVPVWYNAKPIGTGEFDVDSVLPGTLSFMTEGLDQPMGFEVHDLRTGAVTTLKPSSMPNDGHELRQLANGNFLTFGVPLATADLTGTEITYPNGKMVPGHAQMTIQDAVIVEFEPSGRVVWQWAASEHLDPSRESTTVGLTKNPGGRVVADPFHGNSIDVDPGTGNLLVSFRHLDALFFIERPSGKILWKMGGTPQSKENPLYVPVVDPFFKQHDARLLRWSSACNEGTASVFDDETNRGAPARAVVYDVSAGGGSGAGCSSKPVGATVTWQASGYATSTCCGSFRLASANGTRIVGWGTNTQGAVFSELDANGLPLFDGFSLSDNFSYRVIKVPLDTFDLEQLRTTAGSP